MQDKISCQNFKYPVNGIFYLTTNCKIKLQSYRKKLR